MGENLLPLEQHALKKIEDNADELPTTQGNYKSKYQNLVASLREHVYPQINAGLACLSKSPGIYTDHGGSHFDEVVRYAGLLLGPMDECTFNPYELYLLLCAIRLHDAGNIDGRDEHEKRVAFILHEYGGTIRLDAAEFEMMHTIAETHGGYAADGGKDTIRDLPPDGQVVGAITCSPRKIAALVRFADEICEHRGRASPHHIHAGTLPEENKLFHYYANSITGARPDRGMKSFQLRLSIDTEYLSTKYLTPKDKDGKAQERYLLDEALIRLSKLDCEREYCNQFLPPSLQTSHIDVAINIKQRKPKNGSFVLGDVAKFEFKIPPQSGYPAQSNSWMSKLPDLTGEKIAERVLREWT